MAVFLPSALQKSRKQERDSLCIVIALLIFLRAEGPKKFQQGNKILITPLYSCAENLSQISTFYDAYFRRKFHVTKIGNTIGLLCPT